MVIYGAVNAFSGRERVAQRPDEKFIDSSLHRLDFAIAVASEVPQNALAAEISP